MAGDPHPCRVIIGPQELLMTDITQRDVDRTVLLVSCTLTRFFFQIAEKPGRVLAEFRSEQYYHAADRQYPPHARLRRLRFCGALSAWPPRRDEPNDTMSTYR